MRFIEHSAVAPRKGSLNENAEQRRYVANIREAENDNSSTAQESTRVAQMLFRVREMFQDIGKNDAIETLAMQTSLPIQLVQIRANDIVKLLACLAGECGVAFNPDDSTSFLCQ